MTPNNDNDHILSITLLGVTHKIQYSSDKDKAKAVLDLITEELKATGMRSNLSIAQESERRLLTAALNLSKKYLELKKEHENKKKDIERKLAQLDSYLEKVSSFRGSQDKGGTPPGSSFIPGKGSEIPSSQQGSGPASAPAEVPATQEETPIKKEEEEASKPEEDSNLLQEDNGDSVKVKEAPPEKEEQVISQPALSSPKEEKDFKDPIPVPARDIAPLSLKNHIPPASSTAEAEPFVDSQADPELPGLEETEAAEKKSDIPEPQDIEEEQPEIVSPEPQKPQSPQPQINFTRSQKPEAPRFVTLPQKREEPPPEKKPVLPKKSWQRPQASFLTPKSAYSRNQDQSLLQLKAEILVEKLKDFGIDGKIVRILPGPVITTFEYRPAPGIKISKITNLSNDLALALSAISVRIVAPIPGRDVVGIEIPNPDREMVRLREIIESEAFKTNTSPLALCLGKDIEGKPVVEKLNRMPHLLIAGATGTGKSVGLNAMITSLIYKSSPNEIKLLMIDPKRIELSFYNEIPHLIAPVVTDMKLATNALFWAVREMERRYELLDKYQTRNVKSFNEKVSASGDEEPLPYIVVVIDELADLMMVASRDVETALARLAQMARAAGIHLILATQRPSVDVLTGLIKANFPTRISFQVSSKIDSRTIIDGMGAETLLGNGDMLYLSAGTSRLQRIHGAFISEEELNQVTSFLKMQGKPDYISNVTEAPEKEVSGNGNGLEYDDRYDEAVELILRSRQTSASWLQRQLRIGYNRAARIIETMEREGILGPADGPRPREILLPSYENGGDRH